MTQASEWFKTDDLTAFNEKDRDPSLSAMLEDFLTPQLEVSPDPLQADQLLGLYVSRLALDLPIEIQTLRDEEETLSLGTSPPSQWIETSVEPVLHRLRVTLELTPEEDIAGEAVEGEVLKPEWGHDAS